MALSVVDDLVATFGPFLIPATVFAVGIAIYALLVILGRWQNGAND
jgi:hypothetical protein